MKTFVAAATLAALAFSPAVTVHAEDPAQPPSGTVIVSETAAEDQAKELADLKAKEAVTTGSFSKFILRLKIRQLENQLNVKKALQ